MYSEKTLRARAYRIGCRINKGHVRYGNNITCDCYGERETGYIISDILSNGILGGAYSNYLYVWDLSDIENYLKECYEAQGLKW